MKRYIILIVALICLAGAAFATETDKGKEDMRKELREYRIKFIAQEIGLRADQQQKFAQTYEAMLQEKHKVFSEARAFERKVKKSAHATDEDYSKAAQMMSSAKIKEGEIDRKYDAIFATFLSSKQIYKMKEAEQKFRQRLQEMRSKK